MKIRNLLNEICAMKRFTIMLLLILMPMSALATTWYVQYSRHCIRASTAEALLQNSAYRSPFALQRELIQSGQFAFVRLTQWGYPKDRHYPPGYTAFSVEPYVETKSGPVNVTNIPFFSSRAFCQGEMDVLKAQKKG